MKENRKIQPDQQSHQYSLLAMYDSYSMVCFTGIYLCLFQNP